MRGAPISHGQTAFMRKDAYNKSDDALHEIAV